MLKKMVYKVAKCRYASSIEDKSFYEKNVECFFSGHHATVILTKEAEKSHRATAKEQGVVDFYDFKSTRRPCIAILRGEKVLIYDLDINTVGRQKPVKVLSFWQFVRDYEMADRSEVKVIC